jgi:hypothetical protein
MNIDGDDSFPSFDPEESKRLVRLEVLRYADAGVNTLVYSAAAGSEVMLYPTNVGVNWGWRKTSYDTKPAWQERIKRCKANQDAGSDPLATAAQACRESGMAFVPSLRLNDAHFAFSTPINDYPLTGRFNIENPDMTLGSSPIPSKPQYANLLDFSHEKVRGHRLAQAREIITRYAPVMSGFELDFARFQLFFPLGTAAARAHLLTTFVRQVRALLDEQGAIHHKRFSLFARVPASLDCCTWSGMDIQTWAKEGLVDLASPALMMTAEFDHHLQAFQQAFKNTSTRLYAGLLPRVGFRWQGAKSTRDITILQLRAIAINAHQKGADGLYLFNFQIWPDWRTNPIPSPAHEAIKSLRDIPGQSRQALTFTLTKAYWQDHENTYEYSKQIPAKLSPSQTLSLDLYVGVDLASLAGRQCTLSIGLRDVPRASTARFAVSLAGQIIGGSPLDGLQIPGYSDEPRPADQASHRLVLSLPPSALSQGINQISLGLSGPSPITITDLELDIA